MSLAVFSIVRDIPCVAKGCKGMSAKTNERRISRDEVSCITLRQYIHRSTRIDQEWNCFFVKSHSALNQFRVRINRVDPVRSCWFSRAFIGNRYLLNSFAFTHDTEVIFLVAIFAGFSESRAFAFHEGVVPATE